jgi:hypothetical protein
MQKLLLIIAILGTIEGKELTIEQVSKLRSYNHSISGKMRHKRLLQRTAVVTQDRAYALAQKECCSEVSFGKLRVHSNRLFYWIKTDNGSIKIDALDAQIMERCSTQ